MSQGRKANAWILDYRFCIDRIEVVKLQGPDISFFLIKVYFSRSLFPSPIASSTVLGRE